MVEQTESSDADRQTGIDTWMFEDFRKLLDEHGRDPPVKDCH